MTDSKKTETKTKTVKTPKEVKAAVLAETSNAALQAVAVANPDKSIQGVVDIYAKIDNEVKAQIAAGTPEVVADVLTPTEVKRAAVLITSMRSAQRGFLTLGASLAAFTAEKLYRLEYDSIEAWADAELDMSKQQVFRLMGAAKVCSYLTLKGFTSRSKTKPLPLNEGQVRPLTVFLDDENYKLEGDDLASDKIVECYTGVLAAHAETVKAKPETGRLTAKFIEVYRKKEYPTLKETEKAAKGGLSKAEKEQEKKDALKAAAKALAAGTPAGTPEETANAAKLLADAQVELQEAREDQEELVSALAAMETQVRAAKNTANAAAGMKDSKFIRVALAIGMKECMQAAVAKGDNELIEALRDDMLNVADQFKTANLTIDDLFK